MSGIGKSFAYNGVGSAKCWRCPMAPICAVCDFPSSYRIGRNQSFVADLSRLLAS
jgi:hypothetical protein